MAFSNPPKCHQVSTHPSAPARALGSVLLQAEEISYLFHCGLLPFSLACQTVLAAEVAHNGQELTEVHGIIHIPEYAIADYAFASGARYRSSVGHVCHLLLPLLALKKHVHMS